MKKKSFLHMMNATSRTQMVPIAVLQPALWKYQATLGPSQPVRQVKPPPG